MLDCKHVLAELSNYLDAEVSPELKRVIEEHLAGCHRCSLFYDTTRKTLKIVTEVGPFELPLDISGRLHARLRELFAGR